MKISRTNMSAATVVLCLAAVALLSGCADPEGSDFQRLVCEVADVNSGAPLIAAYQKIISEDDPPVFPIDFATISFRARPYSSYTTILENGPYSYFHITEYDLEWDSFQTQGDEVEDYPIYGGGVDLLVPVNETAEVAILIASRYLKDQTFIAELAAGTRESFTARANLTFRGYETGNEYQLDNPVEIHASLMVHFIGTIAE